MTADPLRRNSGEPEHPTSIDADRPAFDEDADGLPDELDLSIETPEADALDQERAQPFDEDTD